MCFLNIMLFYYFSLEAVLQGVAKKILPKKNLMQKFSIGLDTEAYVSVLAHRKQNAKLIVTNCKDRF